MVKNQVESLVEDALKKELNDHPEKHVGMCTCPSCTAAIQAAALNHLKPFYVTCIAGQVFGEFRSKDLQNYSDVLVAVAKGIEEVRAMNPHGASTPEM